MFGGTEKHGAEDATGVATEHHLKKVESGCRLHLWIGLQTGQVTRHAVIDRRGRLWETFQILLAVKAARPATAM